MGGSRMSKADLNRNNTDSSLGMYGNGQNKLKKLNMPSNEDYIEACKHYPAKIEQIKFRRFI